MFLRYAIMGADVIQLSPYHRSTESAWPLLISMESEFDCRGLCFNWSPLLSAANSVTWRYIEHVALRPVAPRANRSKMRLGPSSHWRLRSGLGPFGLHDPAIFS